MQKAATQDVCLRRQWPLRAELRLRSALRPQLVLPALSLSWTRNLQPSTLTWQWLQ